MSSPTPGPLPEPPSFPSEIQKASVKFITTEALNAVASWPGWGGGGFGAYQKSAFKGFVVDVVGVLVRAIVETSAVIGDVALEVEQKHEDVLLRAAATGVNDLFGTNVQPSQLKGGGGAAGGSAGSTAIANVIFDALFAALKHPQAPKPADGLENAKRILQFNVSTALEGWLLGALGSGVLAKWFPNWADLDDVMVQALGLGRMNRRILQPIMDALVTNPLQRYFAEQYLTHQPGVSEAVYLLNNRALTESEYFEILAQQGYKREWAAALRKDGTKKLGEADILLAVDVGTFTEAAAKEQLVAIGYSDETARLKLKIHELAGLRSVDTQVITTALDMFRDREIDAGRFNQLVRATGASPAIVEAFEGLGSLQRARPKSVERGVMERAYRDGLISLSRLHRYYVDEGFGVEDQFLLEALAIQARLEAEKRRAVEAPPEAPEEGPPLPRGVAEDLHRRGLIGTDELRAAYAGLGFQGARIDLLVRLAEARRAEVVAREKEEAEPKPGPPPPRGLVEDAFVRGILGEDRLRAVYRELGFAGDILEAAVAVQKQRRAERQAAIAAREEAAKAAPGAGPRRLPQATIEDLHRRGLATDERLRAFYVALPFEAAAIPELMERARARRADFERAMALREAPPEPTPVPRGTEEEAFERDIITAADLALYYARRGFGAEDIDLLMELALQRREARQAKLAAASASAEASGTKVTL